jgi:Tol biopolymer transport system component
MELVRSTSHPRSVAILVVATVAAAWLVLAFLLAAPARSAFPGGNGKIAFGSDRDGSAEVWVMNANGSGQAGLTNQATAPNSQPAWSPDGAKIAFLSTRNGGNEIFTMNADGTGQTRLTNGASGQRFAPSWSPDGTKIAFEMDFAGDWQIWTMNADGTGQIKLTNNSDINADPAWSPDGTKIAFYSSRDDGQHYEIYRINADGTGQTRLTNNAAYDYQPAWSPDGTKIAFSSSRDSPDPNCFTTCTFDIYTMNADGTGQTRRTNTGNDFSPAWSPDGTKIALESYRDGNGEIYTMNADGTSQTRITNNAVGDYEPDWQPISYQHPKGTAGVGASDRIALAPAMRQTISQSQCAARGGTPSQHAAPYAVTSCNPPAPVPGTSAYFGGQAVGVGYFTPAAGDPLTAGDQADYFISVYLKDIRAGSLEGADYAPDLRMLVLLRISDKNNCAPSGCTGPYYRPGTAADVTLVAALDCVATADPALGATCSTGTTADALAPATIVESRQTVINTFRLRVNDAGLDGTSGNTDDKLFAQQGIFIP